MRASLHGSRLVAAHYVTNARHGKPKYNARARGWGFVESEGTTRGTIVMRTIRAGIFVLVALLVLIILAFYSWGMSWPARVRKEK